MLMLLPLCAAVCAAVVGYRAGAAAWRRKLREDQAGGGWAVVTGVAGIVARAILARSSCSWLAAGAAL